MGSSVVSETTVFFGHKNEFFNPILHFSCGVAVYILKWLIEAFYNKTTVKTLVVNII